MSAAYGRDLDLNLLRVFAVVAEEASVTRAAARLYLTQPAVSAALTRLSSAVGAKLFVRQGRGLVLTSRGSQLFAAARTHLTPLVTAALESASFDAKTSSATLRIGLFESTEGWLLAPLLALMRTEAPAMQVIVSQVHFRNVEEALLSRKVDMAIAVAPELPTSIARTSLLWSNFLCVFDPRFAKLGKLLSEQAYFAHEHIVVSYAADLRGIVEDELGKTRKVRISVPGFSFIGDLLEGSPLLATVPEPLAGYMMATRPYLRALPMPMTLEGGCLDLLWPRALEDDAPSSFVRNLIIKLSTKLPHTKNRRPLQTAQERGSRKRR